MWRLVLFSFLLVIIGCRDDPPHPNQQAIDRAEKHSDQSAQQFETARQEVKHVQLACSPKLDPLAMRVFNARYPGMEAHDETDSTLTRTDHRQAA